MTKIELAEEFNLNKDILIGQEFNQMVLLVSGADFIIEEDEPITISMLMFYCLAQPNILPRVTEDKGKKLASKCLVSLSLFKGAIEQRCIRYGAPSAAFYVGVGKSTFRQQNMNCLAENFDRWTAFISTQFLPRR